MATQVFDMRMSTGMSRGQSNEHLRCFSRMAFEEKLTHNFDPSREHLNFEISSDGKVVPIDQSKPLDIRIKENLKARGIKDPNEGKHENDPTRRNTVIDIIFQGSRDRMREMAFGNQKIEENDGEHIPDNGNVKRMPEIEEWAKDMYKFACKKFGKENVAAFVVHLDEKNPHIHCTVIPVGMIKGEPRISANSVVGRNKHECRKYFKQLHDDLAEVNGKWGLDRGKDITTTGAKHRTTEEYWKDLTEKCSSLEEKIDVLKEQLTSLRKEKSRTERAVKGLTSMIANLYIQKESLEADIAKLDLEYNEALKSSDQNEKRMMKEMQELRDSLSEVKEKIADKEQKLYNVQQRNDNYDKLIEQTKEELSSLREKINKLSPEGFDKAFSEVHVMALNQAIHELAEARKRIDKTMSSMTPEERIGAEKYENALYGDKDESFLAAMNQGAETVADIANVTAALFFGLIEQATAISESHGGGGSPGTGWGKKKDEDEMAFFSRCFGVARQMMTPVRTRSRRR